MSDSRQVQLEDVSRLDTEITVLETQLTAIKEHRNSLASLLLQMPDELVGRILVQTEKQLFRMGLAEYWPKLMLVCRKVRKVALETPELWSQFTFTQDSNAQDSDSPDGGINSDLILPYRPTRPKLYRKSWMELCYKRGGSSHVGLHINGDKQSQSWPSTLDLARLAPRTRDLYLYLPRGQDEFLRNLFTQYQWPHLTGLEFTVHTPMRINSQLFGRCNALTNLHLYQPNWMVLSARDNASFWTYEALPHLPELRHLTLDGVIFTNCEVELFENLSQCSHLTSLDIHCFPSTCEPLPPRPKLPLSLPQLASVVLEGGTNILSCILSMLPDPIDRLSVRCRHYNQTLMGADMRNIRDRVLKFISIASGKSRNVNERGYQLRLTAEHPTYGIPGLFITTSAPDLGPKRRLLTFSGYCAQTDLFDFMRRADTITFAAEAAMYAEGAFASLASAQPNIARLHFIEWEKTWKTKPAAIDTLEKYLQTRKQQGHRLKLLEADLESHTAENRNFNLEARWLDDELLVDQFLIGGMECYQSSDLPGTAVDAP